MEKVKTDIAGFDALVGGGFPKGAIILVGGTPGTGKTIFGLEYLYRGAMLGEKGLFISFEEPVENLILQAKQFGWNIDKVTKKKDLLFDYIPSRKINNSTIKDIITIVKEKNIKRLVIDSLSTLALSIPTIHSKVGEITDYSIKRFIHTFMEELKLLEETTTLTMTHASNQNVLSTDEISEFLADGIIHIIYESLGGEYSRSLTIRKMRQVKNDDDIHPLEISKTGLIVHTIE